MRTHPGSISNLLSKANALCQLAESPPNRLSFMLSVSRAEETTMALNAKIDPNYVPKRINGKFAPGWSGNPGGSLEATRRSFNKDFLLALAADFKKHGAAAIEKVRKQQPAAYIKICALLVPRELQVEHSNAIKAMSDEQLDAALEALRQLLADREAQALQAVDASPGLPAPDVIDAEALEVNDNSEV